MKTFGQWCCPRAISTTVKRRSWWQPHRRKYPASWKQIRPRPVITDHPACSDRGEATRGAGHPVQPFSAVSRRLTAGFLSVHFHSKSDLKNRNEIWTIFMSYMSLLFVSKMNFGFWNAKIGLEGVFSKHKNTCTFSWTDYPKHASIWFAGTIEASHVFRLCEIRTRLSCFRSEIQNSSFEIRNPPSRRDFDSITLKFNSREP